MESELKKLKYDDSTITQFAGILASAFIKPDITRFRQYWLAIAHKFRTAKIDTIAWNEIVGGDSTLRDCRVLAIIMLANGGATSSAVALANWIANNDKIDRHRFASLVFVAAGSITTFESTKPPITFEHLRPGKAAVEELSRSDKIAEALDKLIGDNDNAREKQLAAITKIRLVKQAAVKSYNNRVLETVAAALSVEPSLVQLQLSESFCAARGVSDYSRESRGSRR